MIHYIRMSKKQVLKLLTTAPVGKEFKFALVPSLVHPSYNYTGVGKFIAVTVEEGHTLEKVKGQFDDLAQNILDNSESPKVHYYIVAEGI